MRTPLLSVNAVTVGHYIGGVACEGWCCHQKYISKIKVACARSYNIIYTYVSDSPDKFG